jgi:hypothetical protein
MINTEKLTEKDIGRWVLYRSPHHDATPEPPATEHGRIKSWNQNGIWVVYDPEGAWHRYFNFTGQLTDPADLTFMDDEPSFIITEVTPL